VASPATERDLETPAFSALDVMAQATSENFPVASRLLPRSVRADLLSLYGFARLVDDIGDEAPGDRMAQLDWAEEELERAASGTAEHPVYVSLSKTIRRFDMPLEPMRDLIAANRQDQVVTRYPTFGDLTDYCMLSAAPVGRLVLIVLGQSTPERLSHSDRVCIGLQLVEHLQDVAEDADQGRIYLPLEDLARFGCPPDGLTDPAHRAALRATIAYEVTRARELLADGVPLSASLPARARLAVAAFSAGGSAALDAIERASFDVIARQCRPRPSRFALRWLGAIASTARSAAAR
jgi:squalene synthase HpnC